MDLDRYELLKPLPTSCLNKILKVSSCSFYEQGETIFLEHDKINNLYFILQGNVTIYKENHLGKRKVIYILSDGAFINDTIFEENNSTISCDAFTNVKLLTISKDNLLKIISEYPIFSTILIKSLSKKVKRLYRQLKNTTVISMEKRIAAKLWKLSSDYGINYGELTGFSIKISNSYLADMLGTNRETISRSLKKLKELNIIIYINRELYVKKSEIKNFYRS
ncbi:Crp/Fnr family transcriptional regulator [Cetobacterium sp. SF1]|uniref:Crp/Fnr family transcriptional regulator n=1 Tax=unclassified Cetobacterium TaxID=2630983 RepID=UPI003CFB13DB